MVSKCRFALLDIGIAVVSLAVLLSCSTERTQPNSVEIAFLSGIQAEKRGDLAQAASSFNESTVLDPNFCSGYFNLGDVYERQAKTGEAIDSFEKALTCFRSETPKSPHVYSESALKLDIERTSNRIDKLKAGMSQPTQ
jgi:tetratricopeptide (TPR) repeat protein